MFCVYVLYSRSAHRIYIGQTSNLIERFKSHNHLGKKGFTVRYRPWFVVLTEFFNSKKDALKREKELKQGKGREWIKQYVVPKYF